MSYDALDRHIEAIHREGFRGRIGNCFLRGGRADGLVTGGEGYPATTFLQVPIMDGVWGYLFRMERYRLKTFIWGDDGYEAWYEYAPNDTPTAKPGRKSRRSK